MREAFDKIAAGLKDAIAIASVSDSAGRLTAGEQIVYDGQTGEGLLLLFGQGPEDTSDPSHQRRVVEDFGRG